MASLKNDWYWAAAHSDDGQLAGDRFIIENGQDALWRRVRHEIDRDENVCWMPIHRMDKGAQLEDILDMLLTVVPTYGVNMNKFVHEAAKIPVFAEFLRNARSDLCNYVSNPILPEIEVKREPYSNKAMMKLGRIVSDTLGCDEGWY